ncbi:MAG: DMT family transporter [Deltaproteobacteria bacterium]|nr:DMT family transporter [Deltaproteobacteria bacterium]
MTNDLQIGISYALVAGALWGVGPLLLKRGMTRSNVSTAILVEQCVSVATLIFAAALEGELFRSDISSKAFWSFVAAGSVGASFGKIFYYRGIDKVGASKSTSIKNGSPILTTFLAMIFLGEELTVPVAIGVLLIVIGILALARSETKGNGKPSHLRYLTYPFVAAVCFGINPVFKKIGVDASTLPTLGALITQTTALIVLLTGGRLLNIQPRWEKIPKWSFILFVLSGVTEALGSLFTFYALFYAPAVLVSPLWRISPLITFLLVRFTLKGIEVVTLKDGVAATFIVGGIFVLSQT